MGAEAEFDDGARVGHQLGLPTIVRLEFLHSCLGLGVPMTAGLAGKVAGFDEGCLNFSGAVIVDCALAGVLRGWLGVFGRGRTTTGVGKRDAGNRSCNE